LISLDFFGLDQVPRFRRVLSSSGGIYLTISIGYREQEAVRCVLLRSRGD